MVQLTFPMIAIGCVVNLFQRGTASVIRIDELLKPAALHRTTPLEPSALAAEDPLRFGGQGEIEFRDLTFAYSPITQPSCTTSISAFPPAPRSPSSAPPAPANQPSSTSSPASTTPTGYGPRRRPSRPQLHPSDPSREHRRGPPGNLPLLRHHRPEHQLRRTRRHRAQIEDAATIAHIRTEILEFPKGFQTFVGERGVTLSGGQKQRTAIARAVIRNPRILILDDALASVDTYTEEQILAGLRTVMQGRTTILISHRVSTARNADQIAVLVEGRIAELGTHDELITRGGYYTRLAEKQQLEEELAVAQ